MMHNNTNTKQAPLVDTLGIHGK